MNLPQDFVKRMQKMLKSEYDDFEKAFCTGENHASIRINSLKDNAKDAVEEEFGKMEEVPWCASGCYIQKDKISGNHPYHLGGLFYFQEPSAMAAAEALPIEKGDFVLDLCAAPGGKSTHLAAKLGGSGLLVANEIVKKRASILSSNIERMGIKNTIVISESPKKLEQKFPLFFDKILVDAPCSGEGMFRKEKKAVEEWSYEHTLSCAERQKNILDSAIKMLRPGGELLYSTCTFAPCENEDVAAYLIKEHGMEIEKIHIPSLSDGENEWCSLGVDVSLSKRIFPHRQKGEGHFIALFKKPLSDAEERKYPKYKENIESVKLYRNFEKENLNISLEGFFKSFGDKLYLLPYNIDIDKISTLRYGLELGECKKGRFEPSHALALALKKEDFKRAISLDIESEEIKKYLSGDVFSSDEHGWCAVCALQYPIGWGKASGGIMKNKLPKGLRVFNM